LAPRPKHFEAALEKGRHALGWTIARLPFDPRKEWKHMIKLRVAGEINGFPFRTSLFAGPAHAISCNTGFYLLVTRAMLKGAAAAINQPAHFALWPDLEPRPAELPDALALLLDDEPGLRDWYDNLAEYTRREIGKWVLSVKSEQSQEKRAMQMAERLLATMEAEQELPPLIATALRRRPKAAAGWARMTQTQRRFELMGVFYYQTPESRAKRLDKLCENAEKRAER
jgi:uncharacterized protein YdeI (YjbR/CyaY-like superfamily)